MNFEKPTAAKEAESPFEKALQEDTKRRENIQRSQEMAEAGHKLKMEAFLQTLANEWILARPQVELNGPRKVYGVTNNIIVATTETGSVFIAPYTVERATAADHAGFERNDHVPFSHSDFESNRNTVELWKNKFGQYNEKEKGSQN